MSVDLCDVCALGTVNGERMCVCVLLFCQHFTSLTADTEQHVVRHKIHEQTDANDVCVQFSRVNGFSAFIYSGTYEDYNSDHLTPILYL